MTVRYGIRDSTPNSYSTYSLHLRNAKWEISNVSISIVKVEDTAQETRDRRQNVYTTEKTILHIVPTLDEKDEWKE